MWTGSISAADCHGRQPTVVVAFRCDDEFSSPGVHDFDNLDGGVGENASGGIARVIGGEYHGAVARPNAIPAHITCGRRREHNARAIVVREDDGPLDGA